MQRLKLCSWIVNTQLVCIHKIHYVKRMRNRLLFRRHYGSENNQIKHFLANVLLAFSHPPINTVINYTKSLEVENYCQVLSDFQDADCDTLLNVRQMPGFFSFPQNFD